MRSPSTTLVIAHRGAAAEAPENTLAAVAAAADAGADAVEVDARLTADGVVVVLHDDTLERTTDCAAALPGRAPWRVEDLTAADIATLRAGIHKGAAQRVPHLSEVLTAARAAGLGVLVELKPGGPRGAVAAQVAALLRGLDDPAWLEAAVGLAGFDLEEVEQALAALRPHRPATGVIVGHLATDGTTITAVRPAEGSLAAPGMTLTAWAERLAGRGVDFVGVASLTVQDTPLRTPDEPTVAAFNDRGVGLGVIADDAASLSAAADAPLSAIITTDPRAAVGLRGGPATPSSGDR